MLSSEKALKEPSSFEIGEHIRDISKYTTADIPTNTAYVIQNAGAPVRDTMNEERFFVKRSAIGMEQRSPTSLVAEVLNPVTHPDIPPKNKMTSVIISRMPNVIEPIVKVQSISG